MFPVNNHVHLTNYALSWVAIYVVAWILQTRSISHDLILTGGGGGGGGYGGGDPFVKLYKYLSVKTKQWRHEDNFSSHPLRYLWVNDYKGNSISGHDHYIFCSSVMLGTGCTA